MVTWFQNVMVCVKGLDKNQQDPVIYLYFPVKVTNSCRDIKVADLNKNKILAKYENIDTNEHTSIGFRKLRVCKYLERK